MTDLPSNLPPLPPAPPGFDRWVYRGTNYASNSGMHDHCEEGCDYWARHTKGYPLDWSLFGDPRTHVIEAVRDEPAKELPATGTEARVCEGETPLTDEFERAECCDLEHALDFARDLERKLAATTKERDTLKRMAQEVVTFQDIAETKPEYP